MSPDEMIAAASKQADGLAKLRRAIEDAEKREVYGLAFVKVGTDWMCDACERDILATPRGAEWEFTVWTKGEEQVAGPFVAGFECGVYWAKGRCGKVPS